MADVEVKQTAGWWPALVEARCNDCGWYGPVRDTNTTAGRIAAKMDAAHHNCATDEGRPTPAALQE